MTDKNAFPAASSSVAWRPHSVMSALAHRCFRAGARGWPGTAGCWRRRELAADRSAVRRDGEARQQRKQLGHPRLGDEVDEGALEVRGPLRLSEPGLQQAIAEYDGVKPENVMITAGSGEVLKSSAPRSCSAARRCSASSRPTTRCTQHATHHQVRGDQAAAHQGLPPGHEPDHRRGEEARQRDRVRLPLQPEQPDRRGRHQAGNQAAARRPAGRHAGADRRGVSPLRRRSELRDLDAVRERRAPGHRRAHVLEDRGDGGPARRLRGGHAGDPAEDASVLDRQRQRARAVRRGGGAQGQGGHGRRRRRRRSRCARRRSRT